MPSSECVHLYKNVKVKLILEQATNTQNGSKFIALLFPLPWRYMEVGGQRHNLVALPWEAGWAPSLVWTGTENLRSLGIRSPDRAARSESLY